MINQFSRTQLLFGKKAIEQLSKKRVAIFGIGGVGGYVCEALVRGGVGIFDIIDNDKVCLTNLNRQIIATHKTIDQYKVDVMKERMLDINPDAKVYAHKCFFLPNNADNFDFGNYDYVVDAVDTISAKIELILRAQSKNVSIISAMGAGDKIDPTKFKVSDIYKTKVCPLARIMRKELKKLHVKKLKVVYSEEEPVNHKDNLPLSELECTQRRSIPGSNSFVPAVAGMIIAGEVIKDLTEEK